MPPASSCCHRASGTFEPHDHGAEGEHAEEVTITPMKARSTPTSTRERDMHFFLDPANAKAMVAVIAESLVDRRSRACRHLRGECRLSYRRPRRADRRNRGQARPGARRRPFVVFHDAYQYFEQPLRPQRCRLDHHQPRAQPRRRSHQRHPRQAQDPRPPASSPSPGLFDPASLPCSPRARRPNKACSARAPTSMRAGPRQLIENASPPASRPASRSSLGGPPRHPAAPIPSLFRRPPARHPARNLRSTSISPWETADAAPAAT